MNRRLSRMKRNQGVLVRAARGEGVICPRCKTYAPLSPGAVYVCTSCGCKIGRVEVGERPAQSSKTPVRGKTTCPSGNLGIRRSIQEVPKVPEALNEVVSEEKEAQVIPLETENKPAEETDTKPVVVVSDKSSKGSNPKVHSGGKKSSKTEEIPDIDDDRWPSS